MPAPAAPQRDGALDAIKRWGAQQKIEVLRQVVRHLLTGDAASVRAETLATIRNAGETDSWPVAESARTYGELLRLAESQQSRRVAKETADQERQRKQRLTKMAADPDRVLAEVKQLVKLRSTANYEQASELLIGLQEALGGRGAKLATNAAARLVKEHPTLHRLKSSLRKRGLLDS